MCRNVTESGISGLFEAQRRLAAYDAKAVTQPDYSP